MNAVSPPVTAEEAAPPAHLSERRRPKRRRGLFEPFRDLPPALASGIGIAVWGSIIAAWWAFTASGAVDTMFLPSPGMVLSAAAGLAATGELWTHIWASVEVVLLGFAISSVIALPLGLWMGTYGIVRAGIEPIGNFMRYLPVTSFVPLFILWIGIGIEQRVMVIFFGTFFPQLVMFAAAARAVPRDLVNAAYTLGTTRAQSVWHVVFPASLPSIFDALRVTIGWAWTYLVVAELVAAESGLGYISLKAMRGFQVEIIFLAIAIIGLLGLLTDQLFRIAARTFLPWTR